MPRDVRQEIQDRVQREKVVVFMKGTPQMPQCGFSAQTTRILDIVGIPFASVNVLEDPEVREGIKAFSNWPTIPQVYVDGEFIGGCDIVTEMYEKGELESLAKRVLAPSS